MQNGSNRGTGQLVEVLELFGSIRLVGRIAPVGFVPGPFFEVGG